MTATSGRTVYRFGDYCLDSVARRLTRADGAIIALKSRAFDTLLYLVEHHDELIDKDRLIGAVWPRAIVTENNLNQAIAAVRRALGDTPEDHRFIVTVPGRGFRFVAEVDIAAAYPATVPAPPARRPSPVRGPAPVILVIGMVLAVLIYAALRSAPNSVAPARAGTAATAETPSLAVLPFLDLSPERDQGYFADGLAEELLDILDRVPNLRLIGRTSSFAFRDTNADLRTIQRTLGVTHVLQGSVRRHGDRVRVTVALLGARNASQLWSESYERDVKDVFAIESDIALHVANALVTRLLPEDPPVAARDSRDGHGMRRGYSYRNNSTGFASAVRRHCSATVV